MLIDLGILLLTALMMYAGFVRGAVVSIAGIGFFAFGGVVGAIVGSLASSAGTAPGAMVGGMVAAVVFGMRLRETQEYVHAATPGRLVRHGDRLLGAVLNGMVGVFLVWFVGAAMSLTPAGSPVQRTLSSSQITGVLVESVSPTGTMAAKVLRSGVIPSMRGPIVLVDEPDDHVLGAPGLRRAALSVVKVKGKACDTISTGTGWVVARGLVVTNAHVVAGHEKTVVEVGGRAPGLSATVLAFDPGNDIAVLVVRGLTLPPLQLAPPAPHGTSAAIVGYPRKAGLTGTPARFDRTIEYGTKDIYDEREIQARISVFRGVVREGNSGSPLLDEHGRVLATVTAEAIGQSVFGGYAVPNDVVSEVIRSAVAPVSTGPCTEDDEAEAQQDPAAGERGAPPRAPVFEMGS